MAHKQKDKYVDLKINGRLFPSWVVANFKEYKLPEIIIDNDDPCNKELNMELRKYQAFVGKYLDFNSPYKSILLYIGLGAGKTRTAINIYNVLYNYTPGWNVFILLKASLKPTWEDELKKFLDVNDKKMRINNIVFISYDSPIADQQFMSEMQQADASKKNLFIIDEVHLFISNVYSNINSKQGKRAQIIYDYIIQDANENQDTRVVALSGTPAINRPFELALLFNLLRTNIFPKSESQFNQDFISTTSYKSINPIHKNLFQRRILGLVSYYVSATPEYFASKNLVYVNVKMSQYQSEIYDYFEEIEERIAKKKKAKQSSSSETYKSYTRQAANFVFPFMGQSKSGEHRPRPKSFSVRESAITNIERGRIDKNDPKNKETYYNAAKYINAIEDYVASFDRYIMSYMDEDIKKKYTIQDDITSYISEYNGDYDAFFEKKERKSATYRELHKCSAKILQMCFTVSKTKGSALVYSNYVLMEGLQIIKLYLKYIGYEKFDPTNTVHTTTPKLRYTEIHGMIDSKERTLNKDAFNTKENKYGTLCKIILISPAAAEGISLQSVLSVHVTEPYWNEVRITQVIGRAIRLCSHKYLPRDERNVDVYRYKSVRGNYPNSKWTTDQYIEDLARSKDTLIQSFLDTIKEAAVDCMLYRNHNTLSHDYKCFQFEENSLFDDQIGPAYKEDIKDDMRMNNGLNSINSKVVRIKVMKIKAVKQLSRGDDGNPAKFSNEDYYWYNVDSGVVYDIDLYYPIGKIAYDDNNIPLKLNKDVYIINKLIPIPIVKDSTRGSR